MKARDVLYRLLGVGEPDEVTPDASGARRQLMQNQQEKVDALLAQTPAGEGVYIAPDGTLMRVEQTYRFVVVEPAEPLYRLGGRGGPSVR